MSTAVRREADVQVRSVLIATDFSPASEKALLHAASIARYYGAKLYVVHVVSSLGFTLAGPEATDAATQLAQKDTAGLVRRLLASGVLDGAFHRAIAEHGDIWTELQDVIRRERIDLLVVGTRARTGVAKLVLGSVAERIFRLAGCLVLTVGPASPRGADLGPGAAPRPHLFATDFSDASLAALPYAVSVANHRRAKLALVHVLPLVPRMRSDSLYTARGVESMEIDSRAAASKRLHDLAADIQFAVDPQIAVEVGDPTEGILRTADGIRAELITIGLRCRTHPDAISHLPWSTAYDVVCRAGCPVLTMRTRDSIA